MKARRRHELQKNVLGKELGKAAELFREYGTHIVWGGVALALSLLVVMYFISKGRQRQRDVQARYQEAMFQTRYDQILTDQTSKFDEALKDLKALADQDTNRDIAAKACLAVGDVSAGRLVKARSSTPAIDRKSYRDQAEAYYHKAIAGFGDRPVIVGRAHLGLAHLAESRRDFDAAEAEYQLVLAAPALQDGPVADAAAKGMKDLNELRSPALMATTAPAPRKVKKTGKEEDPLRPGEDPLRPGEDPLRPIE